MRAGRRTRWWPLVGAAVTGVDGSVERAVPCAPAHRRRQSRVPGVPRRCTRPHSRRPAGPGRPAELPRDGDHTPVAGGLGANVQSEFTEGSGRRLLAPAVAPVADAPAVVEPSTTLRPIPALAPVSERRWTSRQQELPIPGPCATLAQASDPVAAVPWCRSPRAERSRCPRSVAVRKLTIGPWVRALGPECHWPQSQVVGGRGRVGRALLDNSGREAPCLEGAPDRLPLTSAEARAGLVAPRCPAARLAKAVLPPPSSGCMVPRACGERACWLRRPRPSCQSAGARLDRSYQ